MNFTKAEITPELKRWAEKEIKEKSNHIEEIIKKIATLYSEIETLRSFLEKEN